MSLDKDRIFAAKICKGNPNAVSEFYDFISDEIYFLANKHNSFIKNDGDYYNYELKNYKKFHKQKGHTIKVNDEVSNDAIWLFNEAKKKTCKYEAKAPLINFITYSLFAEWTRKNLIRYKTGVTDYLPKLIQELSKNHQEVFKLLVTKKTKEDILSKLNINEVEYFDYYNDIEKALIKSNMLELIRPILKISLSSKSDENDDKSTIEIPSENLEIDDQFIYNKINDYLTDEINRLLKYERRLLMLYWGKNLSVKQINSLFKSPIYYGYLTYFQIKDEADVTKSIANIEYRLFRSFNKKRIDLIPNDIDRKLFKKILKHYFIYMDKKNYE